MKRELSAAFGLLIGAALLAIGHHYGSIDPRIVGGVMIGAFGTRLFSLAMRSQP